MARQLLFIALMTSPPGPFCQSCAMPLVKPEDYGTEATGQPSKDYCAYCYAQGAFLGPDLTMDQMRELCVDKMVERAVMPRAQAAAVMTEMIPKLKRWARPA